MTDLVSLIVPCYNMEAYLSRFLDSVLEQTWSRIQLILVNDGSTDRTLEIIESYLYRLGEKCTEVKVIDQENAGLAGAVDAGLKVFTGEFLSWPDPDDWLLADSIESRVNAMRRHPQVGLVRANAYRFDERSQTVIDCFLPKGTEESLLPNIFESLVFLKGYKAPIAHFARSHSFLCANGSRSIYFDRRSSQNQQMLLPLVQRYPVLEMREPTGYYCVRDDSRSNMSKTPEQHYRRCLQILDIAEHVVPTLTYYGDAEEGMKRVRDYHIRNRMLPGLFGAGMKSELAVRLNQARLSRPRMLFAKACGLLRCNRAFQKLDDWLDKLPSRMLNQSFIPTVRMSDAEMKWPELVKVGGGIGEIEES